MRLDSGIATIWRAELTSSPGEMPRESFTQEYFKSYYGDKTVGFARYWTAKAHDSQATFLVEIQRNAGITTADRCQLAPYLDLEVAGYYKILQVQHLEDDNGLPVTDLTLERIDCIDEP